MPKWNVKEITKIMLAVIYKSLYHLRKIDEI